MAWNIIAAMCALLDLVEAWCQEYGRDSNISLSQIHVWEAFNIRNQNKYLKMVIEYIK